MATQSEKLLNILQSGESVTARQITARTGAANPREVVRTLRENGFAIYLNQRTNSKGETKGFYRLGTPSRAMVAAAYATMGADFAV